MLLVPHVDFAKNPKCGPKGEIHTGKRNIGYIKNMLQWSTVKVFAIYCKNPGFFKFNPNVYPDCCYRQDWKIGNTLEYYSKKSTNEDLKTTCFQQRA